MIAEIQRLENAARLSMATFSDGDQSPARKISPLAPIVLSVLAVVPLLAVFMYY